MNKITSAAAVLIVGLFLAGITMVPLGTASASASSLEVGDRWAMGNEVDYGSNVTANMDQINSLLQSQMNMSIDSNKVISKLAYYTLFEVTGETETTYTVTAKMAVRFATSANIEVTGSMPVAGVYGTSENPFDPSSSVARETKTMSLNLEEKMGMVLTATTILEKSTMAIANMTWTYKGALSLDVDAKNIPDINTTEDSQTIAYKDYDVGAEIVAGVDLFMDFAPSLDLLQLPVTPGELWYTNTSMVTISGSVNGHIDAHGLTDDQKASIFTEELANATGATDFPINFENLNTPSGEIKNGQFGPYTTNITSMKMRCMYGSVTYDVDGESRQYQKIQVNDGAYFLYSADVGFMTGMLMDLDDSDIEIPDEADYIMTFLGTQVNMGPMDAKTASDNIDSIESYTSKLTADVNDGGFNINDFFFKMPFLGTFFVIIAAISIVILAFFAVKHRKP
ncbi:MAG: hypothetical protein JET69_02350 [Methanomassiliicoccales archaeon]|nr:hypothetical protein [Methanomassiliicoccales archaeon]